MEQNNDKKLNEGRKEVLLSLKSPIQIFGLLLLVMESLFVILFYSQKDYEYAYVFVIAIAVLPIFFGLLFYQLFTKHPHVIFTPDFSDPKDYINLIRLSKVDVMGIKERTGIDITKPFSVGDGDFLSKEDGIIKNASKIEQVFNRFESEQLFNLHTWFNANNKHRMALMCIDLVIARGDIDSLYFSYRSGSLRKLGRTLEALYSARMAKQLDSTNVDSYYNIARALRILDKETEVEAKSSVDYIMNSGNQKYIENISKYYNDEPKHL